MLTSGVGKSFDETAIAGLWRSDTKYYFGRADGQPFPRSDPGVG
jgi:hypothetical protein